MSRLRPGAAAVVLVMAFVALFAAGCGSSDGHDAPPPAAVASARQFLRDYVTPGGAVVRRDQGGDVVSEGQGYAMLLAVALDDPRRFGKIWGWTREHLQRPDGLFAYHWQDGAVLDSTPAADADLQIAWALSLAGSTWSLPEDTAQSRRIAQSVAEHEIGYDDQGHPTLAAGPWALGHGQPMQVEPGYWTFPAYEALAELTGDHRWEQLATADAAHLSALTGKGSELPPDWATLGNGTQPEPAAAPQSGEPPTSGQDGLRALVWAACLPAAHPLVEQWWKAIASTARTGPLTRSLDGTPRAMGPSALSLVAAAATAKVAGQGDHAAALLRLAGTTASDHPTYYGDAWNALGQMLLTTDSIPGCDT
jgi:endoglucanase